MIEKTNTYYSKGRFVLKKCDDNEVTTDELYTVYTETQGIVNTLMDMNQSHGYGY